MVASKFRGSRTDMVVTTHVAPSHDTSHSKLLNIEQNSHRHVKKLEWEVRKRTVKTQKPLRCEAILGEDTKVADFSTSTHAAQ